MSKHNISQEVVIAVRKCNKETNVTSAQKYSCGKVLPMLLQELNLPFLPPSLPPRFLPSFLPPFLLPSFIPPSLPLFFFHF